MAERSARALRRARILVLLGSSVLFLILTGLGVGTYLNSLSLVEENDWIEKARETMSDLEAAFGLARDAETGQRGYLLTGDEAYLVPYEAALAKWPHLQEDLKRQAVVPDVRRDVDKLIETMDTKLTELAQTVNLYKVGKKEEALQLVKTDMGMSAMRTIRQLVGWLQNRESENMARRLKASKDRARSSSIFILLVGLVVVIAGGLGGALFRRSERLSHRFEGQLKGVLEGSSDLIAAVDLDMNLILFNKTFVDYYERHNKVTPKIGDYLPSLIRTLSPEKTDAVLQLYRRGARGEEFTVLYQRESEGKTLSFELRFSPIRSLSGRLIGTAQIMHDITGFKDAEKRSAEYAQKLEASNRELTDFAFIASHDLQEPLRKIQAFGDRLKVKQADKLTDEGRDYLERMQSAATRMQRLINDLLDYSRVTTKGRPPEPVNLRALLAEVTSDLQVSLQESGGRVDVGMFPPALGDPVQLRQLFQNLIGNALKYHRPEVAPVVTVSLETHPVWPPRVSVRDNGIGFDPKHSEKIFEIFQRLHGRDEFEGTGIGLAICRKIVERHGGTLTAEGHPGEGAVFWITFPQGFWSSSLRTE